MNDRDFASSRPPRVVIIDDYVFPYRVPFFAELARQAIELTVLFCTSRIKSRSWKPVPPAGFKHEFLPGHVLYLKRRAREDRMIFLTPTLLFRLFNLRPDVVIAYAYSVPTIIAFVYCRLAGKRFISWADGTPHSDQMLTSGQKRIRRFIIPRAKACLTPTPAGRENFINYGADPSRVWMIAHAASHEIREMVELARNRHQTLADRCSIPKPRVLYVGSLTTRKAVNLLLEAVAKARPKLGRDIQLLIAGDGPLRGDLEAFARELGIAQNVRFLGFVEPDELPPVYAAADLFLFSSRSDTFAFVIGEAIACGLPVIASKFAAAAPLLIEPGENGFIVDPSDLTKFSHAIVEILSDEQRRARMSRKSIEIAHRFSIEEAVQQCLRAICAVLAPSGASNRSSVETPHGENLHPSLRT